MTRKIQSNQNVQVGDYSPLPVAPPNYYIMEEACELLHLCSKTIGQHILKGKLKAFKVGKRWFFTPAALDEFIQRGSYTAKEV
jgi:excisionase family DNA binding protein